MINTDKKSLKVILREFGRFRKEIINIYIVLLVSNLLFYMLPVINMKIIDKGICDKNKYFLIKYVVCFLLMNILYIITDFLASKLRIDCRLKIEEYYKKNLLDFYIVNRGMKNQGSSIGELDEVIRNDVNIYVNIIMDKVIDFLINVLKIILSAIFLLTINYILALCSIIFQLLNIIIQNAWNKKLKKDGIQLRESYINLFNIFSEISKYIKTLFLISGRDYEMKRYRERLKQYNKSSERIQIKSNLINYFVQVINCIYTCILLLSGGFYIIKRNMTIGEFLSFIQYSSYLTVPISAVMNLPQFFFTNRSSILRMSELIRLIEKENKKTNDKTNINLISLKKFSFKYDESDYIFRDVNIDFDNRNVNYIVGRSGIGKTTLFKILTGEQKNEGNMIFFNNIDINNFTIYEISEKINWVPQEPIIFNDTIRNNILMDREIDENEFMEICKACNLDDFVRELPLGYETLMNEDSDNISFGQKKRITLARAFIDNKPVLLIDECSAGLDAETEQRVKLGIEKYLKGRIVIIITHNRQFINKDSNVYKIEEGSIVLESR